MIFNYLTDERKVVNNKGAQIPQKMQEQLDYIANVIYTTGHTPLFFAGIRYRWRIIDINNHKLNNRKFYYVDIKYACEGQHSGLVFRIDQNLVDLDETVVTIIINGLSGYWHINLPHDHSSILRKISNRYHIDLVIDRTDVKSEIKLVLPLIKMMKGFDLTKIKNITLTNAPASDNPSSKQTAVDKLIKFCGNIRALPNLEKLQFYNPVTDKDCELLSKWISNGSFAGRIINISPYNLNDILGHWVNRKPISVFESSKDALIYLSLDYPNKFQKINMRIQQRESFI